MKKIKEKDLELNPKVVTALNDGASTPKDGPSGFPDCNQSANYDCQISKKDCVPWTNASACLCATQNMGTECVDTQGDCQKTYTTYYGDLCCAPTAETQQQNCQDTTTDQPVTNATQCECIQTDGCEAPDETIRNC